VARDGEERVRSDIQQADQWLKSKAGITLGTDYNITLNQISESPGANAAAGGVFRLYGHWNPVPKNEDFTGRLVFKMESRHRLGTDIPPQTLGPTAGYAGLTATTFSASGWILTNFFWSQSFADNRFAFNIGLVDFTDYVNVYGLINIWTEFNNLTFATEPTFILPNQGLGAAVRFMFTPNYYIVAGIADVNGNPNLPLDVFSSFFGDAQYFTHVEIGRISSWDDRYSGNTHLTFWHADESNLTGADDGWGMAFSWSQQYDRWLPFARAAFSEGSAPFLNRSVSVGTGYQVNSKDYLGIGLGWGQPPKSVTDGTTVNQYTLEAYYRVKLMSQVSIWPSFQYFINPAYRTDDNNLWLLGLRMRAVL
jgi:porin